jgi:hypothetical protein
MHHRGGVYSSLLSVLPCMNCAVRVFRFHTLRATTQRDVFKCEITWPGKLSSYLQHPCVIMFFNGNHGSHFS